MKLIRLAFLLCLNAAALLAQVASPLKHLTLTSAFGYRIHPLTGRYAFHSGIDLRAANDTVYAVSAGVVCQVGFDRKLGLYICQRNGMLKLHYGHLSRLFVLPGDSLAAGTPIALTGATGRVTAPHLHLSISYNGRNIDPVKLLFYALDLNNQ